MWLRDWLDDLAGWSADQVAEGIGEWRRSDAKRMPRPGDLIAILKKQNAPRAVSAAPTKRLSEREAFETLKAADFESLALWQKAELHRLYAAEAHDWANRLKARIAKETGTSYGDLTVLRQNEEWRDLERRRLDHLDHQARFNRILDGFRESGS